MAEIDKARVHIVLPEPSLFLDEQKSATAAIMLKLKTNHKLEEGQVKGIVKLVSNSVEGLTAENVTIVDMAGNILSEDIGSEGNAGRLTVSQVEIQKQYQKDMQTSVQSMLEKILGLGKVVVRVQMELDFDKIQRKITDFGEKVVRSEQVSEETAQNTSTSSAGVPGTDSNIPGYETGEETGSSESSRTDKVRNYEIDTIEEIKEVAQGSVKRLSVAVVVDKEIDTKLQTEIENLVKSSVGFDGERGDQISLAGIPFNTEYQEEMTRQLAQAEKRQIYMYAGLAILAFVIIGVVIGVVVRRRRLETQIPLTGEIMARPFTVEDDEDIQIPEKEFTPEEKEQRKIKERVEKVAREQPDDVAQLIRSWLAQE
jgi:flagellar M-ring protein FliF